MRVLLLQLLCCGSVCAQTLTWNPVTGNLPGASINQMMNTTAGVVAISELAVHIQELGSTRWQSRYLPNDVRLVARGGFCVAESPSGVMIWSVIQRPTPKLMLSTDLGTTWKTIPLSSPFLPNGNYTPFASKNGNLWLYEKNPATSITTLYRTIDNGNSFEAVAADTMTASLGNVTELANETIVALDRSLTQSMLYVYFNGVLQEIHAMPKGNFRSITSFNNTIVLASDTAVYKMDYPNGAWEQYDVPADPMAGASPRSLFVKASAAGDLVYTRTYSSDKSVSVFKNASETEFSGFQLKSPRPFVDASFSGNSWLFGDQAGIWRKDGSEVRWYSEGMLETYIWRFAVTPGASEVVAMNAYGDVFYRSLENKSVWVESTPDSPILTFERGNDVFAFPNGKKVLFINNGVHYATDKGADWKKATLPESVLPSEIVSMKVYNTSVYLLSPNGVLVSSDFGNTYQWLAQVELNSPRDFTVVDDTAVVVPLGSELHFISTTMHGVLPNTLEGEIVKVFTNTEKGMIVIRMLSREKVVVSRSANQTTWVDSDTITTDDDKLGVIDAIVMPDYTVYLTTYYGMYRLRENSQKFELLTQADVPYILGGLKAEGNRLYRAQSPGMVEYAETSTSVDDLYADEMNTLKVFPLPASTSITVTGILPGAEVLVTDINGCEVYRAKANTEQYSINTATFSSGIYLVTAGEKSQNFVVQK